MLLEDPRGQDAEISSQWCVQPLAGLVRQLLLGRLMLTFLS